MFYQHSISRSYFLGIAIVTTFTIAACSSVEKRGVPPYEPIEADVFSCEGRETTVDALLENGNWPFVLGYVESVEPVMDQFIHESYIYNDTPCADWFHSEPALRVRIQIEETSWDRPKDEKFLTLGFNYHAYSPNLDLDVAFNEDGTLTWTDGNSYFTKGTRVLAIGGQIPSGDFFTGPANVFEVDAKGSISKFTPISCVDGTLNGRDVYDVLDEARRAGDGRVPKMNGEVQPLATFCNTLTESNWPDGWLEEYYQELEELTGEPVPRKPQD